MTAQSVYMVDTSGSMLEGDKKEQVCSIVEQQVIHHLYPFGDTIRKPCTPSQLRELEFNQGTQLEPCLLEMFEILKTLSGNKKNFVLITDAEDTIPFVEDVKIAWQECIEYHKKQGAGDGFLTGDPIFIGRGECAKAIEEIFGAVQPIEPDKVKEVLQNLTVAIEAARKCDEKVTEAKKSIISIKFEQDEAEKKLDDSKTHLSELKKEIINSQGNAQQWMNTIEEFQRDLSSIQGLSAKIQTEPLLDQVKRSSAELKEIQEKVLSKCKTTVDGLKKKLSNFDDWKIEILGSKIDVERYVDSNKIHVKKIDKTTKGLVQTLDQAISTVKTVTNINAMKITLEQIKATFRNVKLITEKTKDGFKSARKAQQELNQLSHQLKEDKVDLENAKRRAEDLTNSIIQAVSIGITV